MIENKTCGATIGSARIEMPATVFDGAAKVFVTIGGAEQLLFTYYPDELSFTAQEFVGLSREAAVQLRHKRDVDYLRS